MKLWPWPRLKREVVRVPGKPGIYRVETDYYGGWRICLDNQVIKECIGSRRMAVKKAKQLRDGYTYKSDRYYL